MAINWKEMGGNFIELPKGQPVRLHLKNWKQQDKFKEKDSEKLRFGLTFEVWKENNFEYDDTTKKEWTVTAVKACKQLKPIIEKAEAAGKNEVIVSVVVAGENKSTVYTITEMPAEPVA